MAEEIVHYFIWDELNQTQNRLNDINSGCGRAYHGSRTGCPSLPVQLHNDKVYGSRFQQRDSTPKFKFRLKVRSRKLPYG